jgi:hypothetical protein
LVRLPPDRRRLIAVPLHPVIPGLSPFDELRRLRVFRGSSATVKSGNRITGTSPAMTNFHLAFDHRSDGL